MWRASKLNRRDKTKLRRTRLTRKWSKPRRRLIILTISTTKKCKTSLKMKRLLLSSRKCAALSRCGRRISKSPIGSKQQAKWLRQPKTG
jgi:hypothetical protein